MNSECKFEHQTVQPTLSVRFRTPLAGIATQFRRAYVTLGSYMGEMGARPVGPPFAIYHNMDSSDLDVEAGFVVEQPTSGKDEIHSGTLQESELATAIHTGPYETVGSTYSALTEWAHGCGLTSAGPFLEFYLDDPVVTPALELRTKVALPVEPA